MDLEQPQKRGASSVVARDWMKVEPVMMLVVATMYSTPESSCWDRNLQANTLIGPE